MTNKLRRRNIFLHESYLDAFPFKTLNTQLPAGDMPAVPPAPGEVPIQENTSEISSGALSIGVYTASRALPVQDAVVTVYILDENRNENILAHYVTDRNGRIPDISLPSVYDPESPLESRDFYFSTYNFRVQAINYYTQNFLDIRIFPDTTTRFNVDLIPVAAGTTGEVPEQTVVIPPSPLDISNTGGV